MAQKTSLEKSHSKWSNFKLTLLSVLTSLFVTCFWVTLALKDKLDTTIFTVALIVSGVLTAFGLALFNAFKR
ncbi:MAG: hypothetical protein IJR83_01515 [Clostridia bacterium]|nr:hypothetical protein [Clostridia bacterium]